MKPAHKERGLHPVNKDENTSSLDQALAAAMLDLLSQRGGGKTICPSEAARRVAPGNWRALMEQTRAVADRLVAAGEIVVTQHGHQIDVSRAKGPIRLRRS